MSKQYDNLYGQIIDFDNLLAAYHRARQGKKKTNEMHAFHFDLETNLWELHHALKDGSWFPGAYRNFYIYEPKKRKISAAPFADRVVHHALCAITQPLLERKFIAHGCASPVNWTRWKRNTPNWKQN